MTHRGPCQPLLFCDSVILCDLLPSLLHCDLQTCPALQGLPRSQRGGSQTQCWWTPQPHARISVLGDLFSPVSCRTTD